MAIAMGAAAMTAPMTTHAAESPTPAEPAGTTATEDSDPVDTTPTEAPAKPADSDTPATPSDPSEPDTPATPSDPSEPDTPATPSDPSEPNTPATPSDPTDPNTPTTPADPTDPNTPATPTNPADPNTPATPSDPTDPNTPATPTDPTDPDTPSGKPETLEEAEDNLEQAKKDEEAAKTEKEAAEAEEQKAAEAAQKAQEDVDDAKQNVQDITEKLKAESDVTKEEQNVKNEETSIENNQTMTNLTDKQQQLDTAKENLTEIIAGTMPVNLKDEQKKQEAEKQANDLIAAQEAVKAAEEKAKDAEAALGDTTAQEDSAMNKAKEAKDAMKTSELELAGYQEELNALEKKVAKAQEALETAINDAKTGDGDTDQTTLDSLSNFLTEYNNAQQALNTALATQTDVTEAQQTLLDAKTALDNLIKAQEDYATALQNRNDKQTYLDNIQSANSEVKAAEDALQALVSDRTNIKIICDKLQNLTQDKADKLDDLKAKLKENADNFTNNNDAYQNAVKKIDNYLKAVHDLDVPTAELLDATWLTEDSDTDAATAAAEKKKLLNALSEALTGNQSDSAKADLSKAETALNTAKNKLLTAVESIAKAIAVQSDGTELSAPETTTTALSNASAALTEKAEAYKDSTDDTEINLKNSLNNAVNKLDKASTALKKAAEQVTVEANGTTIKQSEIKVATDIAARAIQAALDALVTTQDDQATQGIADANVAAKQKAVGKAQETLEKGINDSTLSDTHKEAINGAYGGLVTAQETLAKRKSDLQSDIAKANETYLTNVAAYRTAYAQLTWLQQDLEDANAAKTAAETTYNNLLKTYSDTDGGQDTPSTRKKLTDALDAYTNAQQSWVSARKKIETTRQSIKDAKETLSAKKTELAKAIAKKTLAETIFAGNNASSVKAEIEEMGFQLSDFDNDIPTYQAARDAVTEAETALTTKQNEHATALATLEEAKTKYELAVANLAIAQGDYDALKPKPSVPSTPSAPVAAHTQSSRANTQPSYSEAYEAVSTDTGHEDDSAYTYSGFLQECEKSILTLKPMNRTSPNLQLSVNNSGLTIKTKTWMSFNRKVIEALSKRPDLALDLSFFYKGKWYRAIIPAGYDLTSLLNEEGYCGFLYLYSLFGVVWQTPAV